MDIKLYYGPVTCAMAPWIMLTEVGAEFETVPVNLRKKEQMTPEYLAVNPKHKVPLLTVDGDPITENAAIHLWIHRNFPDAGAMPSDSRGEIEAVSLLAWVASGIHAYLSRINSPAKVCDTDGSADSVIANAREVIEECFGIANNKLEGKDWLMDTFRAPDSYFFWACRRATQFDIPLEPFANVAAHFDRMQGRDSVQKLLAFEKSVQEQFASAA
jgi:glutathione S-transferase